MKPHRNAFTLVELLVVIGIISVLVAMLLPALNRARQQAMTVQCLAQLRQIGAAEANYVADNGGLEFPAYYGGIPADNVTGEALQNILARYLPMALIPGTQVADASKTIWVCPTAAYLVQNNQQYQQTYGCNMGVHINYSYPNGSVTPNFTLTKKMSQIKRNSEIVSVADSNLPGQAAFTASGKLEYTDIATNEMSDLSKADESITKLSSWSNNDDRYIDTFHMRWRHNNNDIGNCLFVDGHADSFSFKYQELLMRNFATGY